MSVNWEDYYKNEHLVYPLSNEMSEWERHLFALTRRLIPEQGPSSLLDVGCGIGHITSAFLELGIPNIVGMDISPYRINFAKDRYRNCRFVVGSIFSMPFTNSSFDIVTSLEILEHLDDLHKPIEELKRVARKWVLITVPFEQTIVRVLCPHCLSIFNYDGHLHSFRTSDFVNLLKAHRLSILKVDYHSTWQPNWRIFLQRLHIPRSIILMVQKVLV